MAGTRKSTVHQVTVHLFGAPGQPLREMIR